MNNILSIFLASVNIALGETLNDIAKETYANILKSYGVVSEDVEKVKSDDEIRKEIYDKLSAYGVDFEKVAELAKIRTDKYFEVKNEK